MGSLLERFWLAIKDCKTISENSGCWIYNGNICPSTKYGRIQINGLRLHVHRVSTAVHHNLDLLDYKQEACHKCSNRACFNPEHLYLGDATSNQRDVLRSHCPKGHNLNYFGARNGRDITKRYCKLCRRIRVSTKKAAIAANRKER